MRKPFAVAASLAALLLSALAVAPPAHAAPAIQLTKIQYDTPGADTPVTNAKLNAEWVRIKNVSTRTINIAGWRVTDAGTIHSYSFPTTNLGPGKSVTLHTGRGTNASGHRYWGRGYYVWNNTGDTAALRNRSGTVVATCRWTSTGVGWKTC